MSWNGDIADPQMSITAVETVRTTISEEEKNTRQVNFDISIIIKNSLENLSVSFDLSAPEDLTLQNQLTSLTAEQRASQACSFIIHIPVPERRLRNPIYWVIRLTHSCKKN